MNKVTILTEPKPQFNYDGESDRDYYAKVAMWYSSHTKEIDIDEMASEITRLLVNRNRIPVPCISVAVDIGNTIYAYLKEVLNGK